MTDFSLFGMPSNDQKNINLRNATRNEILEEEDFLDIGFKKEIVDIILDMRIADSSKKIKSAKDLETEILKYPKDVTAIIKKPLNKLNF